MRDWKNAHVPEIVLIGKHSRCLFYYLYLFNHTKINSKLIFPIHLQNFIILSYVLLFLTLPAYLFSSLSVSAGLLAECSFWLKTDIFVVWFCKKTTTKNIKYSWMITYSYDLYRIYQYILTWTYIHILHGILHNFKKLIIQGHIVKLLFLQKFTFTNSHQFKYV